MEFRFLEWDTNFFGLNIGRIDTKFINKNSIKEVLQKKKIEGFELIYLYHPIALDTEMEYFPEYLVDIKCDLSHECGIEAPCSHIENNNITEYNKTFPDKELLDLTFQSGAQSRFKKDLNFSPDSFQKLYSEWIKKSITKELADFVFVANQNGKITGMITFKVEHNVGTIGLMAVDKNQRNKGIGSSLIQKVKYCAQNRELLTILVSTQKLNREAIAFYKKNNFKLFKQTKIYHFWLRKLDYDSF